MKKMDLNRLRAGQREQAIHDVKAALLLERVAEEENVQVSDEELNHDWNRWPGSPNRRRKQYALV